MSNDLETRIKSALEKAKPVLDTLVADLEREATLIKERDLDPRKLAEEPKVQEARSAAVEALENLTAFAKSLDSLVKSYAPEIDRKIDVDAIKEQIAAAPGIARSRIEDSNGHGVAGRVKATSEDAKARLEATAHEGRERVEETAHKGKEQVAHAAHKGKDGTAEMLAALGWAAAAATVIYVVFMDEKRRRQAKSVAKAAGNGLLVVVNSAGSKKS
jgi:hypothetical protein